MSEPDVPPVEETVTLADEEPIVYAQAPPIESRFLYVDVAALRAKQLHRGARVRIDRSAEDLLPASKVVKPERLAMEEVRQNLVQWNLPDFKVVVDLR